MKCVKNFFFFAVMFFPMAVSAQWWESSFDLDVGYRKDTLSCLIEAYDSPGNLLLTDDLNINKIYVLEIGAKGKCIAWDKFLLKSFLYSGTTPRGNYNETVTDAFGARDNTKLKVDSGQTVDFSLGGGFLFPICLGVRIGPTGGWSYNHQHLKMHGGGKTLNGLKYKNRWQGAWIGVDSYLSFCGYHLNAGYEYHIPHWSAYWLLKKKNVYGGAFSDVRKSTKGYGNVVYLDFYSTNFFCIRIDCQVKYQYWKMRDGCEHPKSASFASVGLDKNEQDKIPKASWQSFELLVGLGLDF